MKPEGTILREFGDLLRVFNTGELSLEAFLGRLEELHRRGLRRDLAPDMEKEISDFVIWYADMHDPQLPPRSGFLGKVHDRLDALRGVHRVSEADIRSAAKKLEERLSRAHQTQVDGD